MKLIISSGNDSNSKVKWSRKDKREDKAFMKGPKSENQKEIKCFFCKKMGHFKKECHNRNAWFDNKRKY